MFNVLMLGQRLRRWPNIKTTPIEEVSASLTICESITTNILYNQFIKHCFKGDKCITISEMSNTFPPI